MRTCICDMGDWPPVDVRLVNRRRIFVWWIRGRNVICRGAPPLDSPAPRSLSASARIRTGHLVDVSL
jgi:hypothetical protein